MLAYGNLTKVKEIKPYCFNVNNTQNIVLNNTLAFKHFFLENCNLLNSLQPWLGILSFYGIVIGAIWVWFVKKVQRGRQFFLQPWLSIIPIARGIYWLQVILRYSTCPWTSDSSVVIMSMFSSEVLSVITVICFNTIISCIFYQMSLGWNITIFRIERNKLTNIIVIGGSLYLVQLARNYSQDSTIIPFLFLVA